MFCRNCGCMMKKVYHFDGKNVNSYYKCNNCYYQSKLRPVRSLKSLENNSEKETKAKKEIKNGRKNRKTH